MRRVPWFVFFLIVGVSCLDQPDCFRQNLNLVGISFRKLYDGKLDTLNVISATPEGYMDDLPTSIATSGLSLPLNYLETETTFNIKGFTLSQEKDYTIKLSHRSKPQFVSEDCGQRFVVSDLQLISTTGFDRDSIALIFNSAANPAGTNMIIYRCPQTDIMRLVFRQLFMDTISRGRLDSRVIDSIAVNSRSFELDDAPTPVNSILLPLDLNATSSAYTFYFGNDQKTLSLNYKTEDRTIIQRCGTQKVISALINGTSTFETFEVVRIANDSIHDPPVTNVETYRCPVTNLIRIAFKSRNGSSLPSKPVKITNLKADYLDDVVIIDDTTASSLTLRLNPLENIKSTTFTCEIDNEPCNIAVSYNAIAQEFHTECGEQTVFSSISITFDLEGTTTNTLINEAEFPTVDNFEVIF